MVKVKTSKSKPVEPTEVVVRYDLFDLPTAFHKAGLAGLILLIDSLKARRELKASESHYELSETAAMVTFTEPLVRKLMDDAYDARVVEVAVKSQWKGAELKREEFVEEEVEGKKTKTKRFIYDVVQPRGQFLRDHYPDEDGLWLKLWRDMLWVVLRPRDKNRIPYQERSKGDSCNEGAKAWEGLSQFAKKQLKGVFHTTGISSALYPGAQDVNAEGVPFEGRAEQNVLLHFWPISALIFVPRFVDTEGQSHLGKRSQDDKQQHYAVVIPEVQALADFVRDYPRMLASLESQALLYRPGAAVIDLPAEGALAFLDRLAALTGLSVESSELRHSISAVEYLHLVKDGNNIKAASSGRVSPIPKLLTGYRAIVAPKEEKGQPRYRSPLFRRGLLAALLDDEPWYRPFGQTFSTFDVEVFVRQPRKDDKGPPQFASDAAKKFRHETKLFTQTLERLSAMPETERLPAPPPVIVNRVVRSYLLTKTKEKSGIDPDKFKTAEGEIDYKAVPGEFNEAKQKLAQSLILEFRSRRDQAFVDHFALTFFSVTQRLNEADRMELADMLTVADRRDDLKTLTLLALSANS